jgi:diguanylate cyclase (GGDEF)-like protein/PAS domain S-box-containing protein
VQFQGILRSVSLVDLERFADLKPLIDCWRTCEPDHLCDLDQGPLAHLSDNLVLVEKLTNEEFLYLHYGKDVSGGAGMVMTGRTTREFDSAVGKLFADSYHQALRDNVPLYAVDRSSQSHLVHSWQRFILPLPGGREGASDRVIALVRALVSVEDVLTDFARDTGFLGGTLEPVVEDNRVVDFVPLTLSDPVVVFGWRRMDRLSALLGRPLETHELKDVLGAPDGVKALDCELSNSMDRFGRIFTLKVTGSPNQPVFSLSDTTEFVVAREETNEHKTAMEDFAKTASDWMWETDTENRFTMVTDAVFHKSGYQPDYYIGKNRFNLESLPENVGRFDEHKREVKARKPFRNFVYCSYAADNTVRWSRINGVPRYDKNGTFIGYRGTGSNITAEVEARHAADERKQAMEDFANTASDWMWETDASHSFTYMSAAVREQTGSEPARYVGVNWFDLEDVPENIEVFATFRKDFSAKRSFRDAVYKGFRDDGSELWIRANGTPRFAKDGTFLGYRGTSANITAEIEACEQVARRTQELADAHRLGRLGAWSFDLRTKMVTLSPEYLNLVGLPADQAVVPLDQAMQRFSPASRSAVQQSFRKVLRSKGDDAVDVEWVAGRSKSMDLSVVAKGRLDAHGRVHEIFGTVQDITERKQAERALEALAFHDPLTGLGNRSYFSRELDSVLQRAKMGQTNAGLLLLDLDHFKEVNDSLGHAAGDELLRRVSERLSLSVKASGIVFRLGGDEFAILVPDVGSADDLSAVARGVISAFSGTITLDEGAVHISTSIGMVMLPAQTKDPEEGMRFADLALYEAKAEGRNRALLFHAGLDEEVQDRVSLARDLRSAVKCEGLEAHYQLQIDLVHGKILGFEALARWNHPTRGSIPPSKFIPIAESSRLIADLGLWMVRAVCRQGRAWLDAGGAPLEMAVNLSVAQLWHRDVESDIANALEESGFPPELLCVELTESVFSKEALPRIRRLLSSLKRMGVKIALDDFGTGYSSLSYLNDLSFDKLKIDRSFVSNCDQNPDKLRLLQGIIGLGKGLGLSLVVEGVETQAELQVVSDLGCEYVQGFFFAKPKAFHEACLDAAQVEAEHCFRPVLWKAHSKVDRAHSELGAQVAVGWTKRRA